MRGLDQMEMEFNKQTPQIAYEVDILIKTYNGVVLTKPIAVEVNGVYHYPRNSEEVLGRDKLKIDQIFQCSSCIMWHSPTCIMWHSPTCIMRHSPTCILALYLQTVRGTRCNTARSSIHIIYICRPAKDSAWHVRSSFADLRRDLCN